MTAKNVSSGGKGSIAVGGIRCSGQFRTPVQDYSGKEGSGLICTLPVKKSSKSKSSAQVSEGDALPSVDVDVSKSLCCTVPATSHQPPSLELLTPVLACRPGDTVNVADLFKGLFTSGGWRCSFSRRTI